MFVKFEFFILYWVLTTIPSIAMSSRKTTESKIIIKLSEESEDYVEIRNGSILVNVNETNVNSDNKRVISFYLSKGECEICVNGSFLKTADLYDQDEYNLRVFYERSTENLPSGEAILVSEFAEYFQGVNLSDFKSMLRDYIWTYSAGESIIGGGSGFFGWSTCE